MPPLSDPPYPFNGLLSGFASTFERYQFITIIPNLFSSPGNTLGPAVSETSLAGSYQIMT
jgi:hypothetical protein